MVCMQTKDFLPARSAVNSSTPPTQVGISAEATHGFFTTIERPAAFPGSQGYNTLPASWCDARVLLLLPNVTVCDPAVEPSKPAAAPEKVLELPVSPKTADDGGAVVPPTPPSPAVQPPTDATIAVPQLSPVDSSPEHLNSEATLPVLLPQPQPPVSASTLLSPSFAPLPLPLPRRESSILVQQLRKHHRRLRGMTPDEDTVLVDLPSMPLLPGGSVAPPYCRGSCPAYAGNLIDVAMAVPVVPGGIGGFYIRWVDSVRSTDRRLRFCKRLSLQLQGIARTKRR
jgi:hypothetical protein